MKSRIQIWAMLLILPLLTSCSDEDNGPDVGICPHWYVSMTPELVWTDGTQWWEAPYIDINEADDPEEIPIVLTTRDGLTYSTDFNHYCLKWDYINDKEYLRVWKNGSQTDQYVRLEDDIVYAYSPQTGNEIVMYDFSSPLPDYDSWGSLSDLNETITFNGFNADGSIKTVTEQMSAIDGLIYHGIMRLSVEYHTPQGRRLIGNVGMYMGEGLVYSYSLNDDCDIPNSLVIYMPITARLPHSNTIEVEEIIPRYDIFDRDNRMLLTEVLFRKGIII